MVILASMMLHWEVGIIPNYLTVQGFGWTKEYWTYLGYIIPALPMAFAVFFLRQYITTIPDELLDAARIDGANELFIWWSIILPLITPALAAMSIFMALGQWNNFMWPLIIVQEDAYATLPLALARMNSSMSGPLNMGVLMAGSLLASLPTIVLFLVFQRQFVEGVTLTGIKQ